jgi:hypothetical protein
MQHTNHFVRTRESTDSLGSVWVIDFVQSKFVRAALETVSAVLPSSIRLRDVTPGRIAGAQPSAARVSSQSHMTTCEFDASRLPYDRSLSKPSC